MGYSEDASMVRVDFFKSSGKWYTTEAVQWTGNYIFDEVGRPTQLIHEGFAKSLRDHFEIHGPSNRLSSMDAICLEPYNEHSHPIMIKNGGWLNDR